MVLFWKVISPQWLTEISAESAPFAHLKILVLSRGENSSVFPWCLSGFGYIQYLQLLLKSLDYQKSEGQYLSGSVCCHSWQTRVKLSPSVLQFPWQPRYRRVADTDGASNREDIVLILWGFLGQVTGLTQREPEKLWRIRVSTCGLSRYDILRMTWREDLFWGLNFQPQNQSPGGDTSFYSMHRKHCERWFVSLVVLWVEREVCWEVFQVFWKNDHAIHRLYLKWTPPYSCIPSC